MRCSLLLVLTLSALLATPAAAQIFPVFFDDDCPFNSNWDCPQNWSTDTVPPQNSTVTIGAFTVTGSFPPAALASLTLNGTMLRTSGDLSVGKLNWNGGTIETGGTLTVTGAGSTWPGPGSLTLLGDARVRFAQGSDVVWTDGIIELDEEAVIENAGVFDIRDDRVFDQLADTLGAFLNEATGVLRKSTGTVTDAVFGVPIINDGGTIAVEAGTLRFIAGGTLTDGIYDAALDAALIFDNHPSEFVAYQVIGTLMGIPTGIVGYEGSSTGFGGDSAITGSGTFDFDGTGFHIFGGASIGLTNTGLLVLTSADGKLMQNFLNTGTTVWDGGEIYQGGFISSPFIRNEGLFDIQGDLLLERIILGDVENRGVFRKSAGSGTGLIDSRVTNYPGGIIEANAGTLRFTNLSDQPGSMISGSATFESPNFPFFEPRGTTSPGTSPGILSWTGDWSPQASAILHTEIGGSSPGSGYDQLAVSGDAILDGTLDLVPIVGIPPEVGDTYTVLTAGSVSGTFDAVAAPPGYTFDVAYNATDVTVTVLAVPNVDLIAANTTPLTVPQGGSVTFDFSITNNTNGPLTGDLFYTATPGNVSGVIINDGTLPGGNTIVGVPFTQNVPVNAPPGTYTYTLRIGQFPNTTLDAEAFTVMVVPARLPGGATGPETWTVSGAVPWGDGAEAEAAPTAVPEAFGLAAAYPNPFRSRTTFALDVPETSRVSVAVYDALGRRVAVLLDGEVEAATHRLGWDAASLPSGVYLVRATGADVTTMQRVTLVR